MKPVVLEAFYRKSLRRFSPLTMIDLRQRLKISESEIRHHLHDAYEKGLVMSTRTQDNTVRIYELTPSGEEHVLHLIRAQGIKGTT